MSIVATALLAVACAPEAEQATLCGEPLLENAGTQVATIDESGLPSIIVSSENRKTGVGVMQADTCKPVLQLADRDSDGIFDLLTYQVLNPVGEVQVEVEDYGMDGQPDLILNRSQSSARVFFEGRWYDVDGVGAGVPPRPTVTINGETRALEDVLLELGRPPR